MMKTAAVPVFKPLFPCYLCFSLCSLFQIKGGALNFMIAGVNYWEI